MNYTHLSIEERCHSFAISGKDSIRFLGSLFDLLFSIIVPFISSFRITVELWKSKYIVYSSITLFSNGILYITSAYRHQAFLKLVRN